MRKKRISIIVIVLISVLLPGTIWQYTMTKNDKKRYLAVGDCVHTDAYDMHYYAKGEGESVVVFITGSGTPCAYTDFYNLQESLSCYTQTISFDHAGSGLSGATDIARTVENLESEMMSLLDFVAPNKNIILVCHSLGSLEAIYFAQCHPDKVQGIVFLDSGDPEFYQNDSELSAKLLNRVVAFTRVIGLNRLLCDFGIPLALYGENERLNLLPEEIKQMDKAVFTHQAGNKQTINSIDEMNENGEKVNNGPRLGDIPILVLSSDSGEQWNEVQERLSTWSSYSQHYTIKNSTHYLHWSNFNEVEEYVRLFVDKIINN